MAGMLMLSNNPGLNEVLHFNGKYINFMRVGHYKNSRFSQLFAHILPKGRVPPPLHLKVIFIFALSEQVLMFSLLIAHLTTLYIHMYYNTYICLIKLRWLFSETVIWGKQTAS